MLPLYTTPHYLCVLTHFHTIIVLTSLYTISCTHAQTHWHTHTLIFPHSHTVPRTLTHFHFNDPVIALSFAMSSVSSGPLPSFIHQSWSPQWLKEYKTLHNMPYSTSQATRSRLYSSFDRQGTWGPERERYSAKIRKFYECLSRGNPRALK